MRTCFALLMLLVVSHAVAQKNPEKLTFELRLAGVKSGEAFYQTNIESIDNKENIHAVLYGYTTGLADDLFAVNDRFESFIEKNKTLPGKSLKKLKEKDYRFEEEILYFHDEEVVFSDNSGWHDVKYGICDISALIYHVRFSDKLQNLQKNQVVEIPFWDTDEWYMLELKYAGIEKIETDFGEFECIRLEPLKIAGRFFNRRNPMNVWLSNDDRKLPVLMELNFTVGSFKCYLVGAS